MGMGTGMLMEQFLDELAERVAGIVSERVVQQIQGTDAEAVRELPFCYTEKEAAEILKCNPQTLANRRKDNLIEYAKVPGDRILYMPHHILNYLLKHEVRAGGNQPLKAADVLRFPKAA